MAEPPAADAPPPPPPADDAPTPVDRDVWLACATPLSRIPAVGSQVYYFRHGYSEQCPVPPPASPLPDIFPCSVAAVRLFADPKTDEPYATVSLVPGPHRDPADAAPHQDHAERGFCYYAKQLTQSDANNGGGFSVPRSCAELVFPPLDFKADPPVQTLRMRDLLGAPWDFRHIYRGTPRRHLLTTGWTKFVNAKLLVAGDAVVFMRRPNGDLIAGVRRTPRYPAASQGAAAGQRGRPHNARAWVPPQEVDDATRLAAEGRAFTVTYYPRQGAGEFVVPRKEVEDAMVTNWEPGLQVRMKFLDAEERRSEWINGVVKAVDQGIWRMLEIDWGESSPVPLRNRHVNAWQVELVGCPPILKKLKFTETIVAPLWSGDVGMAALPEHQNLAMLQGSPVPAGMQGARHIGLTDQLPSSSTTVFTTQLLFPRDREAPPSSSGSPVPAGMQGARHIGLTDQLPSSSATVPTTQLLFPQDREVPPSSSGGSSEVVNPEEIGGSPPNNSVNIPPSELPEEVRSIQLFGTTITSPVQSATNGSSEEVNQVHDAAVVDGTANEDASSTSPLDLNLGADDGPRQNDSKEEA